MTDTNASHNDEPDSIIRASNQIAEFVTETASNLRLDPAAGILAAAIALGSMIGIMRALAPDACDWPNIIRRVHTMVDASIDNAADLGITS